jgi:hypothetical protein
VVPLQNNRQPDCSGYVKAILKAIPEQQTVHILTYIQARKKEGRLVGLPFFLYNQDMAYV